MHNLKLVYHIAKNYSNENNEIEDLCQEGYFGLNEAIDKYDISRGASFSTFAVWKIKNNVRRNMLNLSTNQSLDDSLPGTDNLTFGDEIEDPSLPIDKIVENQIIGEQLAKLIEEKLEDKDKEIIYLRYGFKGREWTYREIGNLLGVTPPCINERVKNAIRRLSRTGFIKNLKNERRIIDKKVDEGTSFLRGINYDSCKIKSSNKNFNSPVESLVLYRDRLRKEIQREYM